MSRKRDQGTDFSIITKRTLNPMEAGHLLHDLGVGATNSLRGPKPASIAIVAPYLSERTREAIAAHGVSYIDSTGNMRLQSDKPALYVLTNGADRDPWFDHQPLKSLRGAERAVRCAPSSTSPRRTACANSPAARTSPQPLSQE